MDILPPGACVIVDAHLMALLYWFSTEMYQRVLVRAQDHYLVRLDRQLDTTPLAAACAGYHHSQGPGAPVAHPVAHPVVRLVRALLIKYLLNLSLRELEQTIRWNLLVKWFVGYPIFAAGPDHATLERFELWVLAHQTRTFFDEVLRQIDRTFPADRCMPQLGDTFALHADAARESLIQLLRHTCRRLLCAVDELCAQDGGSIDLRRWIVDQLDLVALWGAADEVKEYRLDGTQRRQRLTTTVVAAVDCHRVVSAALAAHPTRPEHQLQTVTTWLTILEKILADELAITYDQHGQVGAVHELPKSKKGS